MGCPKKIKKEARGTQRKVEKSRTENRKIQETASTIENGSSISKRQSQQNTQGSFAYIPKKNPIVPYSSSGGSAYKKSKRESHRQLIAVVITSKILKKYRLQKLAQEVLGFSRRRWKNLGNENVCYYKSYYTGIGARLKEKVTSFFVHDNVSRITAGKKLTITKGKKKMQK